MCEFGRGYVQPMTGKRSVMEIIATFATQLLSLLAWKLSDMVENINICALGFAV